MNSKIKVERHVGRLHHSALTEQVTGWAGTTDWSNLQMNSSVADYFL
jgi:hypothetical protein